MKYENPIDAMNVLYGMIISNPCIVIDMIVWGTESSTNITAVHVERYGKQKMEIICSDGGILKFDKSLKTEKERVSYNTYFITEIEITGIKSKMFNIAAGEDVLVLSQQETGKVIFPASNNEGKNWGKVGVALPSRPVAWGTDVYYFPIWDLVRIS